MADLTVEYLLTTPGPDITFNDGVLWDGLADKFWFSSIQGLDMAELRTPTDPVPFGSGSIVHTFWRNGLSPVFDGMLLLDPPTLINCQSRRNALAFNLLDALESIVAANGTLAFTPVGQAAQSLTVRCNVPLSIQYTDDYRVSTFSFGLISETAQLA